MSVTKKPAAEWKQSRQAHRERVEKLTAEHLARRTRGQRHPVWDFLFDYYPVTPGKLGHWSPGFSTMLLDATSSDVPHLKYFRFDDVGASFNIDLYWARRGKTVRYIRELLSATLQNPAHFDCFGLHEWAMVYGDDAPRHPEPLRLGRARTNQVVDEHHARCTHFDAFRFFTEQARPLNEFQPTRQTQPQCEQSACLHANMDLYKWATKLGEAVPGELWLDTFELARDIRQLDMEASPYDLSEWGFQPVQIETAQGKSEYVRRQRELSSRANTIRRILIDIADAVESVSQQAIRS